MNVWLGFPHSGFKFGESGWLEQRILDNLLSSNVTSPIHSWILSTYENTKSLGLKVI